MSLRRRGVLAVSFAAVLAAAVPVASVSARSVSARSFSARSVSAVVDTGPPDASLVRPEEGQIIRLYAAVLGRNPDTDGFHYWVIRRIEGIDLTTVAASFVASAEFEARFAAPTDDQFLDRVYRNVLDRPPDPGGLAYWIAQMRDGLTRPGLVLAFSESAELANRTGTAVSPPTPYSASIEAVGAAELGASWRPGCPVDPIDLRAVTVSYIDLAGVVQQGTIVVHRRVASAIVTVFGVLYDRRYPIASLRPVSDFDGRDDESMAANNSSGFNCRVITGGTGWSRHAYGMAVDLNPLQNPYVSASRILPPAAAPWVDRRTYHPAMIRPGDVVTGAFAAAGWRWGGDFTSSADFQHFER